MSSPGKPGVRTPEWFERAFEALYLDLYAHRDESEARDLLATLRRECWVKPPVLDLGCGGGRFLRALSEAQLPAIGLDLSRALLRHAGSADGVPLVRGDMRRLPFGRRSLGTVVLLFTSFGYFEQPSEDRAVLLEAHRVLALGGHLVLDFFNPAETRRTLVPESRRRLGDLEIVERRWIDPLGPFVRKQIQTSDGRSYDERVRLYTPTELIEQLEAAGFRVERPMGDYAGGRFDDVNSTRCLLVAERVDG